MERYIYGFRVIEGRIPDARSVGDGNWSVEVVNSRPAPEEQRHSFVVDKMTGFALSSEAAAWGAGVARERQEAEIAAAALTAERKKAPIHWVNDIPGAPL